MAFLEMPTFEEIAELEISLAFLLRLLLPYSLEIWLGICCCISGPRTST
jgi:hypothetical protein